VISLDFETKAEADLRKVGLDAYTAHRTFDVLMMAYRIDDGPLKHWEAHKEPFPAEVRERLLDPSEIKWAFNAQFERISTLRGLGIDTPVEGWRCSMALAYMRSFMGGLADIGEQMLIPADMTKKKTGTKLIRQFCMPQRLTKNQPHLWRDWDTDPHDWSLFREYNLADVVAEEAIRDRALPYPTLEDEWLFYALDQRINDRGMPLDRVFAENVARMSERRREELLAQMRERTGLDNPGSQVQLLRWLNTQGYEFDDIGEHTVARALTLHSAGLQGLTDIGVEVLRLRQWAARAATKKAQAALRSAGSDDRIRYMFQFAGASRTNRHAGKLVQPQNMARTPKLFDPEHSTDRLDTVTDLIRAGNYDTFNLVVDEPMMVFGGTMRGMFRAREGYRLHVCDYSSIESVGLAWVSGCDRMLQIFRDKRDFYRDFGTALYQKAYEEITSAERQICKSACLGCLGAYTTVKTDSGMKRLVDVRSTDLVWDGVEFVHHEGVVPQGKKQVIEWHGLQITPDHLVLSTRKWRPAREVFRIGLSPYPVPTYDIVNCGPRHRFMVWSKIGPMIVHNCGYGLGPGKVLDDGTMTGLLAYAANMGIRMSIYEAQSAVAAYRETYDEVPLFWRKCDNAAASVLDNGQPVAVGPLLFEWRKPFLLIRLPSGRSIYYYKPRMEWREVGTGRKSWDEKKMMMVEETYMKHVLTFMGRNQRNARWDRIAGRGAHLTENIVQALTRDVLKVGLMRLDEAGFEIIGHSHDEVIVESREGDNRRTWERMREIMIQPIDWLPSFPLGAAGWSGAYYRK
jgi:hypothetical protein